MYIDFAYPGYLVFLFAVPVLIFFHFYSLKNIKGKALKFANFEAIARVSGLDIFSKNISLLLFDIFFVVTLVLALSGLTLYKEVQASSFSYVIAVDSSDSMSATDLLPSRIDVAKKTAAEFIESSAYTNIAIISFSGNSYVMQDITDNKQALKRALNEIALSGVGGTDIYEAISLSVNLLKGEENKAIILLSDGQINMGDINEAIEYAKKNNVIIHTLGIGTIEGGETAFGMSKLDEDSLKSLAYNSGGKYFNVKSKESLQESFKEIHQITSKLASFNLSFHLIILAIVLFIAKQFLVSINKISW